MRRRAHVWPAAIPSSSLCSITKTRTHLVKNACVQGPLKPGWFWSYHYQSQVKFHHHKQENGLEGDICLMDEQLSKLSGSKREINGKSGWIVLGLLFLDQITLNMVIYFHPEV